MDMSTTNKSKKRKLADKAEPAKKKRKLDTNDDDKKSMTKQEFLKYAKDIIGICGELEFAVKVKQNKTGSVGWNASCHDIIKLGNNKKVAVVIGLNATVIGSKQWEEGNKNKKSNDNDNDDDDDEDDEDDDIKKNVDKKTKIAGDVMTKSEFLSIAQDLKLKLFDSEIILKAKKTKQGSVGWGASGLKIKNELNGISLRLQTSINFTVKKSKQWEEGEKNKEDEEDENDDDVKTKK